MRTLFLLYLAWFASAAPVFESFRGKVNAALCKIGCGPRCPPSFEQVVPRTFRLPITKPIPIMDYGLSNKDPAPPAEAPRGPSQKPQEHRTSDPPLAGSSSDSGSDSHSQVRNPSASSMGNGNSAGASQPRPAPAAPPHARSRNDIQRYTPPPVYAPKGFEVYGPVESFNIEKGDILLVTELPGAPNPGQEYWTLIVGDIVTTVIKKEGQADPEESQDFETYVCLLFNTDKKNMGSGWIRNNELFPKRYSELVRARGEYPSYYSDRYPLVLANVFLGRTWNIEKNAFLIHGAGSLPTVEKIMNYVKHPPSYSVALAYGNDKGRLAAIDTTKK